MKTQPFHAAQSEALRRMDGREFYALFCEQGTGKTWMVLADAEREYGRGTIDALLVVAPKGVDSNWVLREIVVHLDCPYIARVYRSGASATRRKKIEQLFRPRADGEVPPLRILTMNYEALMTKDGFALAKRFLGALRTMLMLDEARRIKNPKAERTRRVMALRGLAKLRRTGTGTPIANAPLDVFMQMEFLESGLLGTTSYRAFIAEYAELVDDESPLMRHIQMRTNNRFAKPQVVLRNDDGTPRWRNLDKLQRLLEPHSYRVLKKDCLDLPDKIYKTRFFDLSPKVRKVYNQMRDELRVEFGDEPVSVQRISSLIKLQQISSGFIHMERGKPPIPLEDGKPQRLALLMEAVEDLPDGASFIVFARFREELAAVARAFDAERITYAEYHGDIKDDARDKAVNAFQSGAVRAFVAQTRAGGIGLTLTRAETVIYYSNSFDLEERLQSEDRAHRIGTRKNVIYIDLVAKGTIDEQIVLSLQQKQTIASVVLGDFSSEEN